MVVAPVGTGKTVLLSDWSARRRAAGGDVLWVPGHETDALEEFLTQLTAADAPRYPGLVVVDDAHVLPAGTFSALSRVLTEAPQSVRLLMASRYDLPVPARELELRGLASTLRLRELRFTDDEAADLIQAHAEGATAEDVVLLQQKTAGWAAALVLAARTLAAAREGRSVTDASRERAREALEALAAGRPPRTPSSLVVRDRLHVALDRGVRLPLTMVVAPVGTGKTVLLSDWSARRRAAGGGVLWVPGHETDALEEFLTQLTAADAPRYRGLGVVDDAHVLPAGTFSALSRVLTEAPQSVRLLMASRYDLPVPARELELRGLASTLRLRELRFTDAEAADLVHAHAEGASAEDVVLLQQKTAGWAAALVLAARTLATAGEGRGVTDGSRERAREALEALAAGRAPRLPSTLVSRERLHVALDRGVRSPLMMLVAPVGTGKTVLLSDWAGRRRAAGGDVLWVPGHETDALEEFLTQLTAGDASPYPDPVVVDDAHLLPAGTCSALSRVLTEAPQSVRLLMASRYDLPVPARELELRGLASTLRLRELRFTDAEAADLVHAHAEGASAEDVVLLQQKTAGWAAALVLAARTLATAGEGPGVTDGSRERAREALEALAAGRAPRLPSTLVSRERLHVALDRGVRSPLMMLVAPVGTGKTVLLSDWAGRRRAAGGDVLWVPGHETDALEEFLTQLTAGDASPYPDPVVVDDAHLLPAGTFSALSRVLTEAPQSVRLLMASRYDLPVPARELELRGLASTLRLRELRFADAEAADLVHAHAEGASAEDVVLLQQKTAGWAAALVLAARTLATAGEGRGVTDGSRERAREALEALAAGRAPRLPSTLVSRERLHVALDRGVRSPLMMLVAPVGTGKTVLLSDWAGRRRAAGGDVL